MSQGLSSMDGKRLRDLMSPLAQLKYGLWRVKALGAGPLDVRLQSGLRLCLRPKPASDLDTAMEVFVGRVYEPKNIPLSGEVRSIVDLGANVGFSTLYFAHRFPLARIDAFEPHPVHVTQVHRHLADNGLASRVTIHPVAVGNRAQTLFLTSAESQSTLTDGPAPGTVSVPVVDWLEIAMGKLIDLLKIDIEGGEYVIMEDPRFKKIQARIIALEWHERSGDGRNREQLFTVLKDMGYRLRDVFESEVPGLKFGMIWAYRD